MNHSKKHDTPTECHTWGQPGADYPNEGLQTSLSDRQHIGGWTGHDQRSTDITSGCPETHHIVQSRPPQPHESQTSPPSQYKTEDYVPLDHYLKQSVRDEPWNSVHVQHKQS
uniref:Uncharacterized protein n=1 Tax=Talaromyces marneffei PM1 TaxID=1077442 RepID=A0A093VBR4_TALMA